MSPQPSLSVTHVSTVTPVQIDELGHMNVRWYGYNAREATGKLCGQLGVGAPTLVSAYTRHHHEQLEGSNLHVLSGIVGGTDKLRLYHELRNQADDDLAATFVHELDHPAIEAAVIEIPDYGRPRTLKLSDNRLASSPSLAELRARDLACRLERQVNEEDLHPNDLLWQGERPGGEASWIHETPDGDRVASATMESRFWMNAFPAIGTRIQSFVANIHVGEKLTHEVGWVFDLDREEVIVAFEGVDLAFSITQRRSVVMPDSVRERELSYLHPDLGS